MREIVADGYEEAPFEVDARVHKQLAKFRAMRLERALRAKGAEIAKLTNRAGALELVVTDVKRLEAAVAELFKEGRVTVKTSATTPARN